MAVVRVVKKIYVDGKRERGRWKKRLGYVMESNIRGVGVSKL